MARDWGLSALGADRRYQRTDAARKVAGLSAQVEDEKSNTAESADTFLENLKLLLDT